MTFRQEKRIFYNWLSKRKLLDEYLFNRESNPLDGRFESGDEFIIRAFSWQRTPQGYYFWLKMDIKWRKHLHRKYKKY